MDFKKTYTSHEITTNLKYDQKQYTNVFTLGTITIADNFILIFDRNTNKNTNNSSDSNDRNKLRFMNTIVIMLVKLQVYT